MAGSRIEKFGTVFSRVQGLLCSGALNEVDKPVWFDIMAAFPPKIDPKFDRFIRDVEPVNIIYKEDIIRSKFYDEYNSRDVGDMKQDSVTTLSQRFLSKYTKHNIFGVYDAKTFNIVAKEFQSEGLMLKKNAEFSKYELFWDGRGTTSDIREIESRWPGSGVIYTSLVVEMKEFDS